MTDVYHQPVLLKESLYFLNVMPGKKYIDATLGGGGHTKGILEAGGLVLGIDQDKEAIDYVQLKQMDSISDQKLLLRHGNFAHLARVAQEANFSRAAGIIFDLGVSTHQLEAPHRGFSFKKSGTAPLDMRMDPQSQTVTAADLINAASVEELAHLFWKFGQERFAKKIARAIVEARNRKPIKTADELAEIILRASWRQDQSGRTHPATRVFQALRIAVNNELENLGVALPQAANLLDHGGRLVIISFHSLEDQIVKNFFRATPALLKTLTDKPVRPSLSEIEANPRARSGKLRAAQKSLSK